MTVPAESTRVAKAIVEHDYETLRSFDSAIIADALEHYMESMERDGRVDEDRLMSRARLFAGTGHRSVEGRVVAWLRVAPSPVRLDIASVVLDGIWSYGAPGTIDAAHVEALLDARREHASTDEANTSSLFALMRALTTTLPETLVRRVIAEIEAASRQPTRHPTLMFALQRVLEQRG